MYVNNWYITKNKNKITEIKTFQDALKFIEKIRKNADLKKINDYLYKNLDNQDIYEINLIW